MGGGPVAAANSDSHSSAQGQAAGRCRVSRRAERATRAGTLISWVRSVVHRARAWRVEASTPAARARLNAMTVCANQAALAA